MKLNELKTVDNGHKMLEPGDTLGDVLRNDNGEILKLLKTRFLEDDKLTPEHYKLLMALKMSSKHTTDGSYDATENIDDFLEDSANDPVAATILVSYSEHYQGCMAVTIERLIFSVLGLNGHNLDTPVFTVIQPDATDNKTAQGSSVTMISRVMSGKRQSMINKTGIQYRWPCFIENPQL